MAVVLPLLYAAELAVLDHILAEMPLTGSATAVPPPPLPVTAAAFPPSRVLKGGAQAPLFLPLW